MKGFGTFDTTNTLYGSFYSRQQDPITNIPKYSKPDMEEQYYNRTLEMQKGYFNRYAHLPLQNENVPQQGEFNQEQENSPIQRPHVFAREENQKEIGEEPVMKTFHRNYEAQQEQ